MKTIKCNLDEKAVEEISNELQIFLNQLNMECRNILRIRLTVEELLLNIIEGCGKGLAVSVSFGKYWGRQVLRIT
jgi:anti-sigma regulatory factor (Ser/Thr protein kinase)